MKKVGSIKRGFIGRKKRYFFKNNIFFYSLPLYSTPRTCIPGIHAHLDELDTQKTIYIFR